MKVELQYGHLHSSQTVPSSFHFVMKEPQTEFKGFESVKTLVTGKTGDWKRSMSSTMCSRAALVTVYRSGLTLF